MNEADQNPHRYDDMLKMEHHVSRNHRSMSMLDRAAQFSPFAALTGYEECIQETTRFTEQWVELDEEAKSRLNEQLCILEEHAKQHPIVEVTHFIPDPKKEGGSYRSEHVQIREVDAVHACIRCMDGNRIALNHIARLSSDLFENPINLRDWTE